MILLLLVFRFYFYEKYYNNVAAIMITVPKYQHILYIILLHHAYHTSALIERN